MRLSVFVLLFGLASGVGAAEPLTTSEAAKSLAAEVVQTIHAGKIREAFKKIRPHWSIADSEMERIISETIDSRPAITKHLGQSLAVELANQQSIGRSLYRVTFLEKLERHPLRWEFIFYRAQNTWRLDSLNWDDKVEPLFAR